MKKFNELSSEELKELYNNYVYSYGWKYCSTSCGYATLLSVEDYYKKFGIKEFELNDKTIKYTRVQ
jgi:hypothetical protein